MKHTLAIVALASGLIGHAGRVDAAEQAAPAGMVKAVAGQATVVRGGVESPLTVGLPLQVGDLIRTGGGGGASITLADDTLLATGPNSELVVTEFNFDPTTQQGGMLLSLWRGVVSVVTGLIAKKTPEQVKVQTRTVVLGVRGTEFVLESGEALQP